MWKYCSKICLDKNRSLSAIIVFNEMRAELKDSIDARIVYEKQNRDLISNISHDLKTPITAIKGYLEGIMDGVADTPEKMDRLLYLV